MAPEVLLGAPATPAADIYSFGVLLHEVGGQLPVGKQAVAGCRWLLACGPTSPPCRPSLCAVQIITGERPVRGHLRMPRVPEECSQVRRRMRASCAAAAGPRRQPVLPQLARPSAPGAKRAGAAPTHPLQGACDLMVRCMSLDPDERPTAQQLLAELGRPRRSTSLDGGAWAAGASAAAPGAALCRRASMRAPA